MHWCGVAGKQQAWLNKRCHRSAAPGAHQSSKPQRIVELQREPAVLMGCVEPAQHFLRATATNACAHDKMHAAPSECIFAMPSRIVIPFLLTSCICMIIFSRSMGAVEVRLMAPARAAPMQWRFPSELRTCVPGRAWVVGPRVGEVQLDAVRTHSAQARTQFNCIHSSFTQIILHQVESFLEQLP